MSTEALLDHTLQPCRILTDVAERYKWIVLFHFWRSISCLVLLRWCFNLTQWILQQEPKITLFRLGIVSSGGWFVRLRKCRMQKPIVWWYELLPWTAIVVYLCYVDVVVDGYLFYVVLVYYLLVCLGNYFCYLAGISFWSSFVVLFDVRSGFTLLSQRFFSCFHFCFFLSLMLAGGVDVMDWWFLVATQLREL